MDSQVIIDLNDDITELNNLISQAKRENVKEKINKCIENLNAEILKIQNEKSRLPSKINNINLPLDDSNISYSSVQSFAWNQEGNKVSIFLTVNNVHKVEKENILTEFDERSFEIKMHNVDKKNYRFCVKKLYDKIIPQKSSFKFKTNSIHVYLIKQDNKYWDNLHFKESSMSKFKPPKIDDKAEPSTMLMDMMKQLYQEGDSDMKRTIAKAWCEANEKKTDFSIPNL